LPRTCIGLAPLLVPAILNKEIRKLLLNCPEKLVPASRFKDSYLKLLLFLGSLKGIKNGIF
jgi:hypothetical protein